MTLHSATLNRLQAIGRVLGEQGKVRMHRIQEVSTLELKEIDLLVLGCPTQHYGLTPTVHTFLANIPLVNLHGLMAAAFDTRYRMAESSSGSAAWVIADRLQEAGGSLITSPESFFVEASQGPLEDGELERAEHWANDLFDEYERKQANENRHS